MILRDFARSLNLHLPTLWNQLPFKNYVGQIAEITFHCGQHVAARKLHFLRDATGALELGASPGVPGDGSVFAACATGYATRHEVAPFAKRFSGKPAAASKIVAEMANYRKLL